MADSSYEGRCSNFIQVADEDESPSCKNYVLKATAPYGSCLFCQNWQPTPSTYIKGTQQQH
jgi:hypothetical protein